MIEVIQNDNDRQEIGIWICNFVIEYEKIWNNVESGKRESLGHILF